MYIHPRNELATLLQIDAFQNEKNKPTNRKDIMIT